MEMYTVAWADRLYYGLLLSGCFGLSMWAVKRMMTQAAEAVNRQFGVLTKGLDGVQTELKELPEKIKHEINDTCLERQTACATGVNARIKRLEGHGHKALDENGNKITT